MTKALVLAALRGGEGYISGESISGRLGISRAAVNAAIMALRREGYDIDSATNRGYLLRSSPDVISPAELYCALGRRSQLVHCLSSVDSTNNYLRTLAAQGAAEGTVVLAESQTGGRGRRGRSFFSPSGGSVYMSYLMRPRVEPVQTACLTACTAAAMLAAVEGESGLRPGIKWVNDLVSGSRKLAGILTELSVEAESGEVGSVVIGIGVNCNLREEDFPEELRGRATSLLIETGRRVNRVALASSMIRAFDGLCEGFPDNRADCLSVYRNECVTVGRDVEIIFPEGAQRAYAEYIDDNFALRVRYPDSSRGIISSGEVSVRGLY